MSGGPGLLKDALGVSLMTGFLGSGKTTVLNAVLKDPRLRDTAVVVNEFGEIGLDHLPIGQKRGERFVTRFRLPVLHDRQHIRAFDW